MSGYDVALFAYDLENCGLFEHGDLRLYRYVGFATVDWVSLLCSTHGGY